MAESVPLSPKYRVSDEWVLNELSEAFDIQGLDGTSDFLPNSKQQSDIFKCPPPRQPPSIINIGK